MAAGLQHMGRLSRAPVIYVLAQIRFTAISKMAEFVPDIQERLRQNYPHYQEIREQEMIAPVGKSGQITINMQQRWDFNRTDKLAGFILGTDAITFHTTSYSNFDEFLEQFRIGLELMHSILRIGLTTRVGIRYVDLIVPLENEQLSDYLVPSLMGFALDRIAKQSCQLQSAAACKTAEGQLVQRLHIDDSPSTMPGDLAGHTLNQPRTFEGGQRKAILDTDHFEQFDGVSFSVEDVIARLRLLQDISSQAFKDALNPQAMEKWK